jgi:hypothetical protein
VTPGDSVLFFAVAYFSLDPITAHQDVLFSNDNMTVTSSSFDDRVVLGSVGLSRGVHYWEISIDRYENNKDPSFGIALQNVARDRMIGRTYFNKYCVVFETAQKNKPRQVKTSVVP